MKTKVEWITPFEVSIMKAKCPKKYIDMLLETSPQKGLRVKISLPS